MSIQSNNDRPGIGQQLEKTGDFGKWRQVEENAPRWSLWSFRDGLRARVGFPVVKWFQAEAGRWFDGPILAGNGVPVDV